MSRPSSAEMAMYGRLGAHRQWAAEANRTARTAAMRAGFEARFDQAVIDKHGVLPPEQHAQLRESERRAYFAQLAIKAANSRKKKAARTAKPARQQTAP